MAHPRMALKSTLLAVGLIVWPALHTSAEDSPTALVPEALFERAVGLFFEGQPKESARLFDALVADRPDLAPALWQRGLALYYADRFEDGRKQFELHRTVNPDDVENPAWHYLCVARALTPEEARKAMLPVGQDARVPMREILALFKGEGTEEEVLAAASRGEGKTLRNQLCYAHLYMGLFAEAHGDAEKARKHILLAAGPSSMDHYMGRVAQVHAKLRGWLESE
jgi:lipoprotein NlpI